MFRKLTFSGFLLVLLLGACGGNDNNKTENAADGTAPEIDSSNADDLIAYNRLSPVQQQMVIKTGQLNIQVDDITAARQQITTLASDYGGYVINSQSTSNGDYQSTTLTIAVDSALFDAAVEALHEIGDVNQETISGEDVTEEYVDLESRLRSLEATRERLFTFLEEAQNVEEALSVNTELTTLESQIEQIRGRMNYLEERTDSSTISISLYHEAPSADTKEDWSPRRILDHAVDAQQELVKILVSLTIWVVIFLGPYLVISLVVYLAWRRWYKRHSAKIA